jgi:hypothetical protein
MTTKTMLPEYMECITTGPHSSVHVMSCEGNIVDLHVTSPSLTDNGDYDAWVNTCLNASQCEELIAMLRKALSMSTEEVEIER